MRKLTALLGAVALSAVLSGCFAIVVNREIHHHEAPDPATVTEETHVEIMTPAEVVGEIAQD
ncbi:hypothetical protein JXA47_07145 [Candidatus Sumerlaeota bacterium]|nr:hypothetical protein [Candidatus Sumerlaeota bacterium]